MLSLLTNTPNLSLVLCSKKRLLFKLLGIRGVVLRLANQRLRSRRLQHLFLLVHFATSHQRVHEGSEEHQRRAHARAERHGVAQEEVGDERLHARLRSARDVVREGRRETDLGDRDDADQESEDARHIHHKPEGEGEEGLGVLVDDASLEEEDHGNEQDGGVHVVLVVIGEDGAYVEAQFPGIVVHNRNHLLGVDAVQRDEERR